MIGENRNDRQMRDLVRDNSPRTRLSRARECGLFRGISLVRGREFKNQEHYSIESQNPESP